MSGKTLQHVGVLGMRWGRRSGGSSKSAGPPSADHATVSAIKKKHLSEMSNDDIQKLATRMNLEKQYKDLNPDKVSRGKRHVGNVLATIGTVGAAATTIAVAYTAGDKLIKMLAPFAKSAANSAAARAAEQIALKRIANLGG